MSAQPISLSSQGIESLASLKKGQAGEIAALAEATDEQKATLLRLVELGFVPGETVRVVARAFPGGHPLAVRLGNTTFALRRHEAELIQVRALNGA